MAPQHPDLETFAEMFLNSPTVLDKLTILKAWNIQYNAQTVMGQLSSRTFWDLLKNLGIIEGLLKYACVDSVAGLSQDPESRQNGLKLQSASMVSIAHFIQLPGIFEHYVEDQDVGAVIRETGLKSYSASFENVVNGSLGSSDLSYHRIASLTLLGSMTDWARSDDDRSIMRSIDGDYVMRLVYYVFFDPTAYQPDDPPDKPPKPETMTSCGLILNGIPHVFRWENNATEDFIKFNNAARVVEWCRALFVEPVTAKVLDASLLVLSRLLEAERFQRPYAESNIPNHILTAVWRRIQVEEALPKQFPTIALYRFAHYQKCILNPLSVNFYRPRITADHARDVILLLGRALITGYSPSDKDWPRGFFEGSIDVIQRYLWERHIDDATEAQLTGTMSDCMDLVLCAMYEAIKSGALEEERGDRAVTRWKDFLSKSFNIRMNRYYPWKRRMNPHTNQLYSMCCWYQCPLYRMEPGSVLRRQLVCSGCRKVSYCSTECQRSDWTEGQHYKTCKHPSQHP